ncbi:MAG: aminoacyl-tRNA deacylase [bacterium]
MGVATTLKDYLSSLHLHYETIVHTHSDSSLRTAEYAHVSGEKVAKSVLLGDEHSYMLVVIPASHRLEIDRLNQQTARHFEIVSEDEVESTFSDCEKGAIPAVGEAYGIDTVVDSDLLHQEDVYFESGDHEHLVHMEGDEFRKLMKSAHPVHVSHHL